MEKKSKKQVIIAVTVLLLVTLTLLGITYAYYRTRIIGNENDKSISVTSKVLEVTYSDDNAVITASDIEPGDTLTKTFNVENTGDDTATYAVIFDNVENNFMRTNDWTFTLKKGSNVVKSGIIPRTTSYVLTNISIAADVTDTYTLEITYANSSEDQSEDMGASLSLRVNIADSIETTFDSATSGTLLAAIGSDNLISEPLTVPGREPTGETEAVFSSTEDVYGKSYYYRGVVENNYVNFSGMCWRIVRVQGDGTIKIALADDESLCNGSGYSLENTSSAFINDWEKVGMPWRFEYSSTASDSLYAGSNLESTLNAWLNGGEYQYIDATIADNTEKTSATFAKIIDTTKLATTKWCNDTSLMEITDSYGDTYNHFGANIRLENLDEASPSLKCDFVGDNDTTSTLVENSIGVLTADEIAFAGGVSEVTGGLIFKTINHYLKDNSLSNFWTMSPSEEPDIIYYFNDNGSYTGIDTAWVEGIHMDYFSVRPVIVLANNVGISGGNGTRANPYVIS